MPSWAWHSWVGALGCTAHILLPWHRRSSLWLLGILMVTSYSLGFFWEFPSVEECHHNQSHSFFWRTACIEWLTIGGLMKAQLLCFHVGATLRDSPLPPTAWVTVTSFQFNAPFSSNPLPSFPYRSWPQDHFPANLLQITLQRWFPGNCLQYALIMCGFLQTFGAFLNLNTNKNEKSFQECTLINEAKIVSLVCTHYHLNIHES